MLGGQQPTTYEVEVAALGLPGCARFLEGKVGGKQCHDEGHVEIYEQAPSASVLGFNGASRRPWRTPVPIYFRDRGVLQDEDGAWLV